MWYHQQKPERRDENSGVDHGQGDAPDFRKDREGQLGHAGQADQHRDGHPCLLVQRKQSRRSWSHRSGEKPLTVITG